MTSALGQARYRLGSKIFKSGVSPVLRKKTDAHLIINGQRHDLIDVPDDMHLGHYLREIVGLTGTRIGCSIGECRACTVMVRHARSEPPVTKQACMISLRHVNGWEVTTIEGLSSGDQLHPIQEAILQEDAMQCGYCAAGFVVAGAVACEHMLRAPGQDVAAIVEAVTGHNLCRCTGYIRYRNAISKVVASFATKSSPLVESSSDRLPDLPGTPNRLLTAKTPLRETLPWDTQIALKYVPLFDNPLLELIRLLRDAAEIEHSLLVQYLFAAFSIKTPQYAALAGWPSHRYGGPPLHVLGVAIEEMIHLDVANNLLFALGAAPHLGRQEFPYEQDIYPFDFKLESLSLETVAKYVYVEAPADAVDPDRQTNPADRAFVKRLYEVLGTTRANHVGSLYRKIEAVLDQLRMRQPDLIDYSVWQSRLEAVREEGEGEHFALFRSLFEGTHPALPGPQIWDPSNPNYPAFDLSVTSGLPPAGEVVPDSELPALRHLGNLHYWTVCMLLDQSYRRGGRFHNAARRHMTGPLRSLAAALALSGEGMPFDVLPTGYAPGKDSDNNLGLTLTLVNEITFAEKRFASFLPSDYFRRCALETSQELRMVI
ncbi:ferritin-like domain-containing protein [Bradyrhizobium sp. CB1717]|uniref:ferritin-like domain-containing protein n=1 Tax=Bradyrhizobium sp. CB1717 TaxID=3039154 RepID=UPI0024B0B3E6|nr:ferritin-like domain-containing protein [Bradyrhizobium sp. CB1717]WFU25147.1 ferritin-like domain-containing protein [Bradyrhizobium sp. CB1717]